MYMLCVCVCLNVHNDGTRLDAAGITVHLRGIDHDAALIASGAAHEPFPGHTLHAVVDDLPHIKPGSVGDKVHDGAAAGTREERLVRGLHFVKVDRLLAVGPVAVAKDVQTWPDTPGFAEEMWASKVKIEVVFLRSMRKCSTRVHGLK